MTDLVPSDREDFFELSSARYHAQVTQVQIQQQRLIEGLYKNIFKKIQRFKKRHPMDSKYAEVIVEQETNLDIEEIRRGTKEVIKVIFTELVERNEKIAEHFKDILE